MRALVKLEQVLPSQLRRRVNALQSATVTLGRERARRSTPRRSRPSPAPAAIASACASTTAAATRPRAAACVEPHTLVNLGPALVPRGVGLRPRATGAPSASTASSACRSAGARFAPRELPDRRRGGLRRGRTCRARRRATRRASPCTPRPRAWPSARSSRARTVEPIDERTCELRTSDDSLDWLAVRVAMLGVDFEVHEPPELVERIRELAARFERAASVQG